MFRLKFIAAFSVFLLVCAQCENNFSRIRVSPKIFDLQHDILVKDTFRNGSHLSNIKITFNRSGSEIVLILKLKDEIFSNIHGVYRESGASGLELINYNYTKENNCYYQGVVENTDDSFAALSTCDGIKGLIYDGNYIYSIDNENGFNHYLKLYDGDFKHFTNFEEIEIESRSMSDVRKRKFPPVAIRKNTNNDDNNYDLKMPYNTNSESYYVELCIVVDYDVYRQFYGDVEKISEYVINAVNIINAAYNKLNIFVALVGIVVWDQPNVIRMTTDSYDTLVNFARYREEKLNGIINNDNAQLITTQEFPDAVGRAHLNTICSAKESCGINVFINDDPLIMARIMAHEMGHNFGMQHDDENCACEYDACLMTSMTSVNVAMHWSSCSIKTVETHLKNADVSCLRNKPKKLLKMGICGNGFVEPGEECDCGLPENCRNRCCDPTTCRFTMNATCATGECCNLRTCQLYKRGKVCRRADSECDLPEYCSGLEDNCPEDVTKANGESCANGYSFCFDRTCQSRDDQCRKYFGRNSYSKHDCYKYNMDGVKHANCGSDSRTSSYLKCRSEDMECGTLQCAGAQIGSNPDFLGYNHGDYRECNIIYKNQYRNSTPYSENVGNGVMCDKEKMCYHQRCIEISYLQDSGRIPKCPDNCNGNGVCNSQGHCHCNKGFSSPNCLIRVKVVDDDGEDYDWSWIWIVLATFLVAAIVLVSLYFLYKYFKSKPNSKPPKPPAVNKKFNVNTRGEVPLIISSPKPCRVNWTTSKPIRPAPPMPNTKQVNQTETLNNKFSPANPHRNFVSNQILYFHLK